MYFRNPFVGRQLQISVLLFATSFALLSTGTARSEPLTLNQAELIALNEEPGIQGLQAMSSSMQERSVAEGQLMDPKIQIGLLNLPTDTFDFDQEAMTQLKVSYIQQFPAGNTLQIKQQKAIMQSDQVLSRAEERKRDILKQVRLSYLEILYWDQAKITIEKNRILLTQLVDIVQSLFSVGRNNQRDVLTVQLGLSKLDDRTTMIDQKITAQRLKLAQWLGDASSQQELQQQFPNFNLPDLDRDMQGLIELVKSHPKILEIDHSLEITRKDIEIVDESSKSGWGLNVSYSFRDDAPNGTSRADFLSAVVTLDLPLFTDQRQDKQKLSKEWNYQSQKDQRNATLRKMAADLYQLKEDQRLLEKRLVIYRDQLLPQVQQRSDAALQAYQSDSGQFSNLMQAYIESLNIKLEETRIVIDRLKTQAQILYLLPSS